MLLEEHALPSKSPPFTIRGFVSTVRGRDFSKCWPFSYRILEKCSILGIKVELPPFEPSLNGRMFGRCHVGHESSKDDLTNLDSKDLLKPSKDLAMEKVFCDAEALNMAVEKVGVSMQQHFLATQKLIMAAEVEALTENLWDYNPVDCKLDIVSNSASQIVVGTLPDHDGSMNLADLHTASTPESAHLETTFIAAMEERNCEPYPVVQEGRCGVHNKCSCKSTVLCDTGVANSLQQSTCATMDHDVHHADRESLKSFQKHATLLKESEPLGCLRKAGRDNNTKDLGLLKSNLATSLPKACPVCLKFSSNSNTALNAHIDHCLILEKDESARPLRKRFKVKKMRSMVDIYASAPVRTLQDLEMSSKIWSFHRVKQGFTQSTGI